MDFWFSGKHKAQVYFGKPKKGRAGKETLDEIRTRKGGRKIEKEDKELEKKTYPVKAAV